MRTGSPYRAKSITPRPGWPEGERWSCVEAIQFLSLAALFLVDLLEIGVNDLVVVTRMRSAVRPGARPTGARIMRPALPGSLRRLVHRFAELHRDLTQCFGLSLDVLDVVAADDILQRLDRLPHRLLLAVRRLIAGFGQRLLGRVDQPVGLVLGFDQRAPLLVLLGVRFGVLDHLLDVGVAEPARGLDADLLLLAGSLVLGRDLDDAVGVDVEGDLDLWHPAPRRGDAAEIALPKQLLVRPPPAL